MISNVMKIKYKSDHYTVTRVAEKYINIKIYCNIFIFYIHISIFHYLNSMYWGYKKVLILFKYIFRLLSDCHHMKISVNFSETSTVDLPMLNGPIIGLLYLIYLKVPTGIFFIFFKIEYIIIVVMDHGCLTNNNSA
jgi:hypothetical protein